MKKKTPLKIKSEIQPQYSGDNSRKFWNEVSKLKDIGDHNACSALGVAIQNMEGQLLKQLNESVKLKRGERR